MGTHPIFESDFDCLTEKSFFSVFFRGQHRHVGDKATTRW